jgi:hypothetical protein
MSTQNDHHPVIPASSADPYPVYEQSEVDLSFRTGLRSCSRYFPEPDSTFHRMVVWLQNSACSAYRFKTAFCFRLPHLSFLLFEFVKSHGNITGYYDLAPSLLRCRKATIIHWNAVSLILNKLTFARVRTLHAVRHSVRAMLL